MDQCSRQQAIRVSSQQSQSIINIEMRSYNSGSTFTKNTSSATATATPFCKVCCDAGLPADKYNSHYVKDQPGPNGKVVCPTLLSQKCLICGVPGHTTRYCPDNPDNSSTSSTTSSSTVTDHRPRYASATDDIRSSLPPIRIQRAPLAPLAPLRNPPRIVYEKKTEFPALPGKFNACARFHNDEPLQKRGPADDFEARASPVHSPRPVEQKFTKVKYNKRNNPFGALQNYQVDSEDDEPKQAQPQQKKTQQLPPITKTSSSSWASVAAVTKTTTTNATSTTTTTQQQQQRSRSRFSIVVPTAVSGLPPCPIVFKARPPCPTVFKANPVAPHADADAGSKQVKKLWGDTDSEDDEEFLKRGLE